MADSHFRDLYCIITGYYNFSIFKMVAVCHLGILKMNFFTAMHLRDTFLVIVVNFFIAKHFRGILFCCTL